MISSGRGVEQRPVGDRWSGGGSPGFTPAGTARERLAGRLAASLPDVRGRDRLVGMVRGSVPAPRPVRGRLTNGVRFSFPATSDGSVRALIPLQYAPPALAPILEAFLGPSDCFYDVGANIGIYALWAARLVGPTGEVHAFEPVPATAELLASFATENAADNVKVFRIAVGESEGVASLETVPGASGLTRVRATGDVSAAMTTLDAHACSHRPPRLIKIDVEGYEAAVLAGARELLAEHRPAVVCELIEGNLAQSGASAQDVHAELARSGYRIHHLTSRGLRPWEATSPRTRGSSDRAGGGRTRSDNVLALDPEVDGHRAAAEALRSRRFPRNQTT